MTTASVSPPIDSRDREQTVVWLDGEHDIATVSRVSGTLRQAIASGSGDVTVDLSGVTFMGAATLDLLLRSRKLLRRQFRDLTLRDPSHPAQRILDLCGLGSLVEGVKGHK